MTSFPTGSPEPRQSLLPTGLTRRHLLVGGAAAGGVLAFGGLPSLAQQAFGPATADPLAESDEGFELDDDVPAGATRSFGTLLTESPDRGIMFPVFPNSATSWTRNQDTYGACRSGCSRRHQGEDLMANKMVKLVSVVTGTVVEMRHGSSGNSLYIRGDDGWFYCYLHINNDTPGTDDGRNPASAAWGPRLAPYASNPTAARGLRVTRGEHVAYCGDSGNAEGSGSHLHFEIRKPASGSYSSETQRLWASPSVNPRESLRNAEPARIGPAVPPTTFVPWTTSADLVNRQYADFLGRPPSGSEREYWTGLLDAGTRSPQWFIAYILGSAECDARTHAVARLYRAFFLRAPDASGLTYWTGRRSGGYPLTAIADAFARSPEFIDRYGTLSNRDFVDRIYQNVLGRSADPDGLSFWTGELDSGRRSRGTVMVKFSDSPENRALRSVDTSVGCAYHCMLKRMPTAADTSTWKDLLSSGRNSVSDMVAMIRISGEYRTVVGR